MLQLNRVLGFLGLAVTGIWAQPASLPIWLVHQTPDKDGIYYAGPEVSAPVLVRTVEVPYPQVESRKEIQGMTVLAMVIGANGIPDHIQLLHSHGDAFDRGAISAVKQSTFLPGKLGDKPVPVWIDVRVVFHANHSQAVPQVLIAERDLAPPPESKFEDKRGKPLPYTEPIPIHVVDADFADPFAAHPYVQVALVEVLVGTDGLPKNIRVTRGLGFGLDKKAESAVWLYKFLPATSKGQPVAARSTLQVSFATF